MRSIVSAAATVVAAGMLTSLGTAPGLAAPSAGPSPELSEIALAKISDTGIGIPGARDRSASAPEAVAGTRSSGAFSFLPSLLRAPAPGSTDGTGGAVQPLAYSSGASSSGAGADSGPFAFGLMAAPGGLTDGDAGGSTDGEAGGSTGSSPGTSPSRPADAIHGSAHDITEDGRTIAALSDVVEPAADAPGIIGVVWSGADDAEVEIRTRMNGQWSDWAGLDTDNDPAQGGDSGTEPYSMAGMDAAQVRILGNVTPHDTRIVSIDPKRWKSDDLAAKFNTPVTPAAPDQQAGAEQQATTASGPATAQATTASGPATAQATTASGPATARAATFTPGSASAQTVGKMKGVAAPKIETRKAWGAAKAKSQPDTTNAIKAAVVHHTDGSNHYAPGDVPAILRGIQAYHQQGRGWDDIGYNVLADKFGRLWEGRGGGLEKNVVGAHVVGYNQGSFGISVMGTYDKAAPPQATLDAVDHAIAWKLAKSGVAAEGKTNLKGKRINIVSGHRDIGDTDCPGDAFYAKLPQMRKDIAAIQRNGGPLPRPAEKPDKPAEKKPADKKKDTGITPGVVDGLSAGAADRNA